MSTQAIERAIGVARDVFSSVTEDQLGNQTPCAAYTVNDIFEHVIQAQGFFAATLAGTEPPAGELGATVAEMMSVFETNTANVVAALSTEGVMEKTFEMPSGTWSAPAVLGIVMTELVVHAWDIAKATGQSTDLPVDVVGPVLANVKENVGDFLRGEEGENMFTAAIDVSDDATPSDQLAAFLGREI